MDPQQMVQDVYYKLYQKKYLKIADSFIVLLNEVPFAIFYKWSLINAILWLIDDMCAKTDFLSSAALKGKKGK